MIKFKEVEKMVGTSMRGELKRHLADGRAGPPEDVIPYDLSIGGKGFYVMMDGKTYLVTWRDFVTDAYLQMRKDYPK